MTHPGPVPFPGEFPVFESARLDHEAKRLRAVADLDLATGTGPDPDLNSLVDAAALACGMPISLIALVGEERVQFKALAGLDCALNTSREGSFSAYAILQDQVFQIPDTLADPRFADSPLVKAPPVIRFYAGAPIITKDGLRVGALTVMDTRPGLLTDVQCRILTHLAHAAAHVLETTKFAKDQAKQAAEWKVLNDSVPFGIYATDVEGRGTQVNAQWSAISGLDEASSLGEGWLAALHPDDRGPVMQAWQLAVADGTPFDREFRILRADGKARLVRSVAHRVSGVGGLALGLVGTIEDVTEVRTQARLLETKRQRLALVVEATGIATVELNLQTGEIRRSPEWAAITGHGALGLLDLNEPWVMDSIHPDDQDAVRQKMHPAVLNAEGGFEIEFRRRHALGHWVWLFARAKVVSRTPDGMPEWLMSVVFEVTERKDTEERLRRSEEILNLTGHAAGVGGWDLDLVKGELTWTDQMRRMRGVAPDFVPDMDAAIEDYAPAFRPVVAAAVEAARTKGIAFDLELQLVRADGRLIWVRSTGSAILKAGKPVRLYGAVQDISDRVARRLALTAAHRRVLLATESTGIGIWELNSVTGHVTWDRQMFRLFGRFDLTDLNNARDQWAQSVHPDDSAGVLADMQTALQGNSRFDREYRIIWPDGTVHHIRSLAEVAEDPVSGAKILLGVKWDITQLRSLSAEVALQHEWMRVTLRSIGDAVITTDAQAVVTWLNPVAEAMTGWPLHDAIGQPVKTVFHILNAETLQPAPDPVEAALKEGCAVTLPAGTLLVSRNGQQFGVEDSAAPIRDDADTILGAVLVFHDATMKRQLQDEMEYRATHDALTGVKNRTEFETLLDQLRLRGQAGDGVHALLYLDLDNFKRINDSCGHGAGDQVLQDVANILKGSIRSRDLLARVGGDEFAILLEDCPPPHAAQIAQKICDQLEVYRFTSPRGRFRTGASIGVVAIDKIWTSSEAIVQAADGACRLAKETGRNRVRVWREIDGALARRRDEIGWAARLEQALDGNQFRLFVQEIGALDPKVTGLHGEILLRLEEPDGSLILPGQFLPSAERFNLITQIDRWVLRETIHTLQDHSAPDDIWQLSRNISGKSVADRAFHRYALALLTEAGPDLCHRLGFEITETSAVGNLASASRFIDQLHGLGVKVSLDDFGAGTASFGYLLALKVDCLKIDGQFVQGLLRDPLSPIMVRSFTEMAQVLKIPIVAEYVDHPDILEALRALDVTFAQGHLIAQPVPILEFLKGAAMRGAA